MYFNTTKENLLNDFCDNADRFINKLLNDLDVEIARCSIYLQIYTQDNRSNLTKQKMRALLASYGLKRIKEIGISSKYQNEIQFYNEIEACFMNSRTVHGVYDSWFCFKMDEIEVLNLCYRAGFYF